MMDSKGFVDFLFHSSKNKSDTLEKYLHQDHGIFYIYLSIETKTVHKTKTNYTDFQFQVELNKANM